MPWCLPLLPERGARGPFILRDLGQHERYRSWPRKAAGLWGHLVSCFLLDHLIQDTLPLLAQRVKDDVDKIPIFRQPTFSGGSGHRTASVCGVSAEAGLLRGCWASFPKDKGCSPSGTRAYVHASGHHTALPCNINSVLLNVPIVTGKARIMQVEQVKFWQD